MRKLLSYLKPYTGRIALATLLLAISAVCDLMLPTLMADVLDKGVYGAAEADTFGYILKTAGWMLGVSFISLASVAGGYWIVYHVVAGYTWSLRSALFRKVHTMTLSEVGRIGTSNLVTRSTHDVNSLNEVISMLCGGILIIPLMLLGGVILCMRKDVVLSLVILCSVPLLIGVGMLLSKRIERLWEVADEYCDKQNDLVRERLRGIRVIRAFDRERMAHEKITDATHAMAENLIRSNVSMEIIDPVAVLALNMVALLVVYLGGVRMERGSGLSAGDIFAIIQYVSIILQAIVSVSYDIVMLPHVRVAVKRLGQITESEGLETDRPAQGLAFSGAIDLEHASFTFYVSDVSRARPAGLPGADPGDACVRRTGRKDALPPGHPRQRELFPPKVHALRRDHRGEPPHGQARRDGPGALGRPGAGPGRRLRAREPGRAGVPARTGRDQPLRRAETAACDRKGDPQGRSDLYL